MAEQQVTWLLKLQDELTSGLDKVGNKFKELGKHQSEAGKRLTDVGKTMTAFVTTTIGGAATLAMNESRKIESSFVNLRQTVPGTIDQLHSLVKELENVAMATGAPIEGLMAIAGVGSRARLSDLKGFTQMMTDLNTATGNFGGEEGAKQFTHLAKALNVAEKDYKSLASMLDWGSDNFNTSAEQIAGMTRELSGLTAITPITKEQLMGISAWAGSFGQEGSTAMMTILNKMGEAVKKGTGSDLGWFADMSKMDAGVFMDLFKKDAPAALAKTLEGLKNMSEEGIRTDVIVKQIGWGGIRTLRTALTGANAINDLTMATNGMNKASKEGDNHTKGASMTYKTLDSTLKQLHQTYGALMVQFGELVLPLFVALAKALKSLLENFTHLPTSFKYAVAALGGLLAIAGPVLMALGSMVGTLAMLKIAFPAVGLAGVTGLAPLAAMLGVMALKAAAIMLAWEAGKKVGGWINEGITALSGGQEGAAGAQIYDWLHPEAAKGVGGNNSKSELKVGLDPGLVVKGAKTTAGNMDLTTEMNPYAGWMATP